MRKILFILILMLGINLYASDIFTGIWCSKPESPEMDVRRFLIIEQIESKYLVLFLDLDDPDLNFKSRGVLRDDNFMNDQLRELELEPINYFTYFISEVHTDDEIRFIWMYDTPDGNIDELFVRVDSLQWSRLIEEKSILMIH